MRHLVATLILGLMFLNPAQAATSSWAETDQSKVRLISQTQGVGDGEQVTLGLQFELKDHWKIYWRSAGDAGYPPSINWQGSTNVDDIQIHWPLPERFSVLTFETLGYKNKVVLPVTVQLQNAGQAMHLVAQVDYLTCAEVCIPYTANLTLDLPSGARSATADAHLINQYQVQVPAPGPAMGLDVKSAEFEIGASDPDLATLFITATSERAFGSPDVFVEGPGGLAFSAPRVQMNTQGTNALLQVKVEGLTYIETQLDQSDFTLTLSDGQRSAEFNFNHLTPVTPATKSFANTYTSSEQINAPSIWFMLALAVLGGVILNFMPCVLPVLSIKLLGVVSHGGGQTRTVRVNFLATAAGVITAFLALAGVLIALKFAGLSMGWGIQFQHPWFLIAMAILVTLFAANMWGFFEFKLPSRVQNLGSTKPNNTLTGHFLTGAFATLLATPCSAPFLGTAVGFALARGSFEIIAIFAALGVGLAIPYLLIAAFPSVATRMPKPGAWMVTLRRILGFALIATSLWLLSVLAVQVSLNAALTIGSILAAMVLALRGRVQMVKVLVVAALAFAVPTIFPTTSANSSTAQLDQLWQPFDQVQLAKSVASGQVVFVDVTAEWCITCQINKGLVLSQDDIYSRLNSSGITAMQADWTRPNAEISAYLASFGRYGIPFNAVYGPGAPGGIALPELLTKKIVNEALDKAARNKP